MRGLPLRPHLQIGGKPVSHRPFSGNLEESGVCVESLSHKPFTAT